MKLLIKHCILSLKENMHYTKEKFLSKIVESEELCNYSHLRSNEPVSGNYKTQVNILFSNFYILINNENKPNGPGVGRLKKIEKKIGGKKYRDFLAYVTPRLPMSPAVWPAIGNIYECLVVLYR